MLAMRARGFALRDAFPDLLRGVISAEEAADIPREPKDITPLAADLKQTLDAFADSSAPGDPAQPSGGDLSRAATWPPEVTPTEADEPRPATGGDSTRPRREPLPAEAEIERSQEEIAALDAEAEHGELLHTARAIALRGSRAFRQWYLDELDDEGRMQLKPHVKALQEAARLAAKM
jgi:hypothetical protein